MVGPGTGGLAPFHHGLVVVFAFATGLSVVAGLASLLRAGAPAMRLTRRSSCPPRHQK